MTLMVKRNFQKELAKTLFDTSKLIKMSKYFIGVIFMLSMFGCKKDDAKPGVPKKDYTSFMAQSTQTFYGKLDGASFSWTFGWNQSQGMAGYENGYGICDSTDPVRVVLFGLISESDLHTRFTLYSPRYNSLSETEFAEVFSLGKKKLGDFRKDFYLSITKDNKVYQSNSSSPANKIEILKTQEFTDYNGKKLRVWFKIDAKLSSCNCQNSTSLLTDGLMIAEFFGVRKEQ